MKTSYKYILLTILGSFSLALSQQKDEIYTKETGEYKVSLSANTLPLVTDKNIIFTLKGTPRMNVKMSFANVYMVIRDKYETKVVFTRNFIDSTFYSSYTFYKPGKYLFELNMDIIDSINLIKSEKVSFQKEVKKQQSESDEDSHHSGMGSNMWWMMGGVMGAMMLVLVMVGMNR